MKTELLALIDDLVKSELYVTEGKFSAAKDAKRIRADIVFLLDKVEQEGAPAAVETCAVCCKGQARLVRICDACSSEYAGPNETRRAPAAVEPVAYLHDDGYWTAAKTEQGRALSDRLHFAGSPKIGVHLHPAPTTKAEPADALDAAFEAVRKKLCKLPKFSFVIDREYGHVTRKQDDCGRWIEFDEVHELFDPVAVDAAIAAQAQMNGEA